MPPGIHCKSVKYFYSCFVLGYKSRTFQVTIVFKTTVMKKVADILARKGAHVTSVSPQTNVIDALRLMANQNIGSVMVMEDEKFLGIMTERDYSRKVILKGRASSDTQVGDIMSTDFPPVTLQHSVE